MYKNVIMNLSNTKPTESIVSMSMNMSYEFDRESEWWYECEYYCKCLSEHECEYEFYFQKLLSLGNLLSNRALLY